MKTRPGGAFFRSPEIVRAHEPEIVRTRTQTFACASMQRGYYVRIQTRTRAHAHTRTRARGW
jgi:hypothetical protein